MRNVGRRRALVVAGLGLVAGVLAGLVAPPGSGAGGAVSGDRELAEAVRDAGGDGPGYAALSVALIENGRTRAASLGPGVHSGTPFEIGSIAKAMTGMLLADMAENDGLDPRTPVREVLDDVRFRDPAVGRVTLEELASHRSGLPPLPLDLGPDDPMSGPAALGGGNPYRGLGVSDVVAAAGHTAAAGQGRVEYSNFGMSLLGQVLARHSGKPYPELLRERVLEPLGMHDTTIVTDPRDLPSGRWPGRLANGHAAAPWIGEGFAPAGIGPWSTGDDMARFLGGAMNGRAPGADAVRPRWPDDQGGRIGYGWFTTADGITWHNGGTGGARSFIGFDRAKRRGVVVLGGTDVGVDGLGLRLLGAEAPSPGEEFVFGESPAGSPLIWTVITALCLLAVVRVPEVVARRGPGALRPESDRLKVISIGWRGAVLLAFTWAFGAWYVIWPAVWVLAVALTAAALAAGVYRWPSLPIARRRRPWLRWTTSIASLGWWALVLGAVALIWAAR